jgi:hypothetical protein
MANPREMSWSGRKANCSFEERKIGRTASPAANCDGDNTIGGKAALEKLERSIRVLFVNGDPFSYEPILDFSPRRIEDANTVWRAGETVLRARQGGLLRSRPDERPF